VNCGIPLAKFEHAAQMANRDSWLKKYNLQSHVKVIGHIGSMGPTPIKNHCFLVDVFKVLSQRRDDCILFMGGDGPLRFSIEKKVNDYGLKNKVIMPGVVSDVPGLMTQLFDVNVVPSVSEGFGVVVTEGVAAGLYNIVSCGVPLQVCECFPGRVERVGLDESPIKWSERIERAIELKIPQHEASATIRRSGFAIEQSAEALLQIYKSRIRGHS
jgi:glycosyltransferase involved in cell wall biosynthesis